MVTAAAVVVITTGLAALLQVGVREPAACPVMTSAASRLVSTVKKPKYTTSPIMNPRPCA
ncbi:MAG: hypothetical protein H7197_05845 [Vitreoscilla sp.]|nr:hypothetical protein [Polaromonas sp.]